MNFLCPACRTPLPVSAPEVVACTQCGVEVDLTRVDTAPGQARLWPEVDLVGEQLGAYTLTSRAGAGGMGTVYVAEGPAGRCAVKVLSAGLAADPALRERFKREAHALRTVQHVNVVRILDEGSDRGFCWYAMEYVEGADLRARLLKGALTVFEVERLAREMLGALGAVHAAQLVHRDLKPGNILLSPQGARLCDFGIARVDGASTLTESAALLGSLRYMAPEQRSGHTSPRADLYSLGVVLHEALGGGLVGDGERPSTPRRLARLIDALLQTQPSRRPVDAAAALKLLDPPSRGLVATLAAAAVVGLAGALFAAWPQAVVTATPVEPDAGVLVAEAIVEPVDAGPALAEVFDAGLEVVDAGEVLAAVAPKPPPPKGVKKVLSKPPPTKSPVFEGGTKPVAFELGPKSKKSKAVLALTPEERAAAQRELDALIAGPPRSKQELLRVRQLQRQLGPQ